MMDDLWGINQWRQTAIFEGEQVRQKVSNESLDESTSTESLQRLSLKLGREARVDHSILLLLIPEQPQLFQLG